MYVYVYIQYPPKQFTRDTENPLGTTVKFLREKINKNKKEIKY